MAEQQADRVQDKADGRATVTAAGNSSKISRQEIAWGHWTSDALTQIGAQAGALRKKNGLDGIACFVAVRSAKHALGWAERASVQKRCNDRN